MDTFLSSLVQSHCGEGGTLKTNNTGVCSQCLSHTGPGPTHSAHSSGLGCSIGNCLRLALGCMYLPGLSRSGSGTQVALRGRLGWACILCPSQVRVAQVFGERSRCDLSPPLSLPLGFLGVQLAHLLRWMLTVQNPKKS